MLGLWYVQYWGRWQVSGGQVSKLRWKYWMYRSMYVQVVV